MSSSESRFDITYIDSHRLIEQVQIANSDIDAPINTEIDTNFIESTNLIDSGCSGGSSSTVATSFVESAPPNTPFIFSCIEKHGSVYNRVFMSPNGSKFWKPDVTTEFKPVVDTIYTKWDDVVTMYDTYAEKAGFSTRLGTNQQRPGATSYRFIHCNRYRKPSLGNYSMSKPYGNPRKRSRRVKLTNCPACIRLKILPNTTNYVLYSFVEVHNHPLIGQEFMDFSKKKRDITFSEQHFIHSLSMYNLGPNISHKVQSTMKGGHHNVRGKTTDFKNFSRDIRMFIGDRDAQLTVDMLTAHTKNLHNFFFDYLVVKNEVRALFWADDVSRCLYDAFGDVLAFDATYKTNKYKMIFVPFTGVDHHKKCITFGAGLLCNETTESYVWLLETFLKAHRKQPSLVLTDQDAAMKEAIDCIFNESKHRLCMWHIMRKLPSKIKGSDVDNKELRTRIHKLVWDLIIDTHTFEERWVALMDEYGLNDHEWLSPMYKIRHLWVPCYFRHIDMCCLMKTTSRCESSNAMFKVNSSKSNTLLQFLMCFDTAIDGQRHKQRELEFDTMTTTPLLKTHSPIERHASEVYTASLFREVQKEIERGWYSCTPGPTTVVGDIKIYTVEQYNREFAPVGKFEVTFNVQDKSASCTCMRFTRIGYLCRHVFCVFKFTQVHKIPDRYISKRWGRDSIPRRVYDISNRYSVDNREETRLRNEILDTVGLCVDRLRRNPAQLSALCEQLKELKLKIFADVPSATLVMPQGIRTKGCGSDKGDKGDKSNNGDNSGKRFVGPGEKAINKYKKGKTPRRCGNCKQLVTDHNARTCERVQAAKASAAAAKASAAAAKASAAAAKASVAAAKASTAASSAAASSSVSAVDTHTSVDASTFDCSRLATELYSGISSLSMTCPLDMSSSRSSDSRQQTRSTNSTAATTSGV
ncbi:hypothetical protein SSX86_024400 [Deinandra increscens subsp. villosa]|uniref:SWIM-type domain-containing protein n=1 Tax=Deinandra increscens subsp. villosa TaxID=3103831 RepID=A0AAP0CHQ9_9ASTR